LYCIAKPPKALFLDPDVSFAPAKSPATVLKGFGAALAMLVRAMMQLTVRRLRGEVLTRAVFSVLLA
jgi:dolichyl-phosphate-mannose--protein O-mannosyl transferase